MLWQGKTEHMLRHTQFTYYAKNERSGKTSFCCFNLRFVYQTKVWQKNPLIPYGSQNQWLIATATQPDLGSNKGLLYTTVTPR